MRVEKRTIVITGASSGLGKGLKEAFEAKGDVVIDISLDGRDYQVDVADHKKLKAAFDEIYKNHGEIDMLVTSAGYGLNGAVELLNEQDTKKQFDVNFFGTANACKYAIPMLKKNGKIVVIASIAGLFPQPFKAYYCSSKAAVDSFAACLRMELSRTKIQVTSICPGEVRTNFTANRVKTYETNERYGKAIENLIKPTEKNQKRRMPPEYAIKKLVQICEKKHYKPRYFIGKRCNVFNFTRKILTKNKMVKLSTKLFYKD